MIALISAAKLSSLQSRLVLSWRTVPVPLQRKQFGLFPRHLQSGIATDYARYAVTFKNQLSELSGPPTGAPTK